MSPNFFLSLVVSAYGPMARDVDSLIRMMRAILCQYHFDLDKTIPPLPFNEEVRLFDEIIALDFCQINE